MSEPAKDESIQSESATREKPEEEPKPVTFSWGVVMVRTKKLLNFLDYLAKYRIFSDFGWAYIAITIGAGAFMVWLMLDEIYVVLASNLAFRCAIGAAPALQCHAHSYLTTSQAPLTAYLLIPGLNPYIPVAYGLIGIIVAVVVHEGTHGVIARRLNLPVKSTGLLFFLFVPIGAFVEIDEKEIQKTKARDSGRIMAGGPGSNIIVGGIALILMILLLGGLVPAQFNGVYISSIVSPSPANQLHSIGHLEAGDIITSMNGTRVSTESALSNYLASTRPGEEVLLGIDHQGHQVSYPLTLGEYPSIQSTSQYNSCLQVTPVKSGSCSISGLIGNTSLVVAIASVSSYTMNIRTPTDSLGTNYSSQTGEADSGTGQLKSEVEIFHGFESASGSDTITLNFSEPASYQVTIFSLWHGIFLTDSPKATMSGNNSIPTFPSIIYSAEPETVIIGVAAESSSNSLNSLSGGQNYTSFFSSGSNNSQFATEYTLNASSSAIAPFTSKNSSSGDWQWADTAIVYNTVGFIGISPVSTSSLYSIRDTYTNAYRNDPFLYLLVPGIVPQAETIVPFSSTLYPLYTSPILGSAWYPVALTLFWVFFININLAFFNAIPLYPLDGGQAIFNWFSHFGRKWVEVRAKTLTAICSIAMLALILLFLFLPRVLALVPY